VLASTRSPASRSSSSFGPYSGDLGSAIKPVRVDSRIPKGAISFMKESILDGLAELWLDVSKDSQIRAFQLENLHFHNAIICANIQDLSSKLVREMRDSLQMLVFVSQCLTCGQPGRVIIS
jgi:hypothetical protein